MNIKKLAVVTAFFSTLVCSAFSDHCVIVDSHLSATAPPITTFPFFSNFSASVNSNVFTAGLYVGGGPVSGNNASGVIASAYAYFKIEWIPDSPYDIPPLGQVAIWSINQSWSAAGSTNEMGASTTSTGSITVSGMTVPNANANFSRIFTPLFSQDSGGNSINGTAYGGFEFHDENGHWVAETTFAMDFAVSFLWMLNQNVGVMVCQMDQTMTLTHAGNIPIL